MLISGTLEHDAIEVGYPPGFIRQFLAEWRNGRPLANAHDASAIESTPSQGSDSSGQLSTTSSTRAAGNKGALVEILSLHQSFPPEILCQKFKQTLETSDCGLSRVDMELIAMALDRFCYSACVASPEDFKDDLCRSYWRGGTMETFKRYRKNELTKRAPDAKMKEKILYLDVNHVSPFTQRNARASTKSNSEIQYSAVA